MTIDVIQAQTLEWFEFKNIYTGSVGDFRYRIAPDVKESKLKASVYTEYSYHHAKDIQETEFPLTEDGLLEARKWIFGKGRELGYITG